MNLLDVSSRRRHERLTADELRALARDAAARPRRTRRPQDVVRWAGEAFGARVLVSQSMANTAVAHLVHTVAPEIPVVFLDTGYHFAETIETRDQLEQRTGVTIIDVTPASDRRRAGRRVRTGALAHQPRPVLQAAQGRADGGDAPRLRRVDHRHADRYGAAPRGHPGRVSSTRSAAWSRSRRSCTGRRATAPSTPSARHGCQSADVPGVSLRRLRAVHASGGRGRGSRGRAVGAGSPRTSAGCTNDVPTASRTCRQARPRGRRRCRRRAAHPALLDGRR